MNVATISLDPQDHDDAIVRFRYNERAVAAIKTLPSRWWDKNRKVWIIPIDTVNAARGALERIGFTVTCDIGPPERTAAPPTVQDAADTLLAAVPVAQRHRVLRALAAAVHPDSGGDGELSRHINRRLDSER